MGELTELNNDNNLVQADPKLDTSEYVDQGGKITKSDDSSPSTSKSSDTSPINIVTTDETNAEQPNPEKETDDESSVGSSSEDNDSIEMTEEVNDALSTLVEEQKSIGGSKVTQIIGHEWKFGNLYLRVSWDSDQQTLERFIDMKVDHPVMTAQYILNNQVSRSKRGGHRDLEWAKKTLRDINRAIRRIRRLYDFSLDDNDNIKALRNNVRKKKKKKKGKPKGPQYKYGIRVPRNVDEAIEIDRDNGNAFWQDATRLEMQTLMDLECFEFKSKGYHPGSGWQPTTLHIIYDVKQDLRRKARLVAGGHLVNILDHSVYASTGKSISVMLLHVIAHKAGLDQLCGDITNAFVTAYTKEKIYCIAGKEFGEENVGRTIIIRKALYGLASSAERFHTHLTNSLRSFGFLPTRYDNDVWIRKDDKNSSYEYICTHVDDFMIVSKKTKNVMSEIETIFGVKESSKGPPDYYLGNDYKKDKKGRWCIGCKKYLKEEITRVETLVGEVPKCSKPIEANDHPDEDSSNL